ncbi:unnamed protein product, partial [Brenthis ino]
MIMIWEMYPMDQHVFHKTNQMILYVHSDLFCLIGISHGVPFNSVKSTYSNEHYVLPGESRPTLYDISLILDPNNETSFLGNVSIRIVPERNTQQIVLHAMEMQITRIELHTEANPAANLMSTYSLTNDTQFLTVESNTPLSTWQAYILKVEYVGTYSRNMFGVYVSNYQYNDQSYNLVTSQLQPTYARSVFPCYDEPHLKAIFRTTIYAPPQYMVVRTNMPLREDTSKPDVQGYVKHEFRDTNVMSTYLIAFLVSNFEFITNEPTMILYRVPFRIYSRRGTQSTALFALDYGQRNMRELQNYMQFIYALPKIDKVAVPDFAAGAMENWGLVIYREEALLVQEGVTTTATLQNIGRIICHENVHMWFGNEVSPRSWTYTWLNEGFANFFENFGTDLVYPTWRMMDQYVLAMQNVMQSDAVLSVNPMTHPVFTPSEIIGTFNAVAYQKSGSVIRMMQHFLTPEIFNNGLIIYIRSYSRRSAQPSDLYEALQLALFGSSHDIPDPIEIIMQRWTEQGGFPVLTIRRSRTSAEYITVNQERYLTDPSLSSRERWHVPINWVLSTNPNFTNTSPQAWVIPIPGNAALRFNIPGLNESEWYILNKQQTGYYRVNYDEANWRALANALQRSHGTIHLLNRAQIIDDSFNLARSGRLEYVIAFEVSRYLINETDYIPWGAANAAFSYLDIVLSGSEAYRLFQQYVLTLTAPLYDQLGFIAGYGEEHVTPFHRNINLDYNCRYGNQQCVNRSQELLQQLRDNPNQSLNPDVQTVVFCSGLRGGSADNFHFLWDRYSASQDSSERSTLLNALGCTSNAGLREFFLNQVLDDNSPVRDQDRHSIIVSTINASSENMEAALDFVIENFARIQPRVQMLTGTTNILNAFSRRLTTAAHSAKIDWLVSNHTAIFSAGERAAIAGIRENIVASIAWSEKNYNQVNSWLNDNYGDNDDDGGGGDGDDSDDGGDDGDDDDGNNANALASCFLVIISIFITIYNR